MGFEGDLAEFGGWKGDGNYNQCGLEGYSVGWWNAKPCPQWKWAWSCLLSCKPGELKAPEITHLRLLVQFGRHSFSVCISLYSCSSLLELAKILGSPPTSLVVGLSGHETSFLPVKVLPADTYNIQIECPQDYLLLKFPPNLNPIWTLISLYAIPVKWDAWRSC